MDWWAPLVDLNTGRRVLVGVELHKNTVWNYGEGETHTEINMAFVFLQMSKHVSHILKSLCVL